MTVLFVLILLFAGDSRHSCLSDFPIISQGENMTPGSPREPLALPLCLAGLTHPEEGLMQ